MVRVQVERPGLQSSPGRSFQAAGSSSTCLPWSRSTSASTSMGVLLAPGPRDLPDWYHRLQLISALRLDCSHAIPHTHTGKLDRHLDFFLHLLGYGSVWHRWRAGRARGGAVRRKPGQIHFISPCYVLSSAVLRDTSLLCGAFLVCDCTKLCICGSLIN